VLYPSSHRFKSVKTVVAPNNNIEKQ